MTTVAARSGRLERRAAARLCSVPRRGARGARRGDPAGRRRRAPGAHPGRAGLPCAEITFRTAAAAAAIAAIAAAVPELRVGAGTVLTVEQAEAALQAGASFIVAPGFDPAVVDFALQRGVPIVPGVCTPTEVTLALARGLSLLKLFPAEAAGGVAYLKALAAPFGAARFVPTGGIGPDNLASYLAVRQVVACGGSWMVTKELIAAGDFDTIGGLACEAPDASPARPARAPEPGEGGSRGPARDPPRRSVPLGPRRPRRGHAAPRPRRGPHRDHAARSASTRAAANTTWRAACGAASACAPPW